MQRKMNKTGHQTADCFETSQFRSSFTYWQQENSVLKIEAVG